MPALDSGTLCPVSQASRLLGILIFAAFVTVPGIGNAAPPETQEKIHKIERAIDAGRSRSKALGRKAEDIAQETGQLSQALVKLGREAQKLERAAGGLRRRIASGSGTYRDARANGDSATKHTNSDTRAHRHANRDSNADSDACAPGHHELRRLTR